MSEDTTNAVQQSRKETQGRKPKAAEPKLVKMVLDGKTADVHPDEVQNMDKYGWRRAH